MINAIRKLIQEENRVYKLVVQVAGIEVDTECRAMLNGFQCALRRVNVIGNLCGVDFQGKANADLVESVQNRIPAIREIFVTCIDHFLTGWGEVVKELPHAAPCEASYSINPKFGGSTCGVFNLLGGTLAHAFWLTVAPDMSRQNILVPLVDGCITNGLSNQVIADRPAL